MATEFSEPRAYFCFQYFLNIGELDFISSIYRNTFFKLINMASIKIHVHVKSQHVNVIADFMNKMLRLLDQISSFT